MSLAVVSLILGLVLIIVRAHDQLDGEKVRVTQ